ncbi:MAG TPA: ADOP family duplicated permease [Gammaproteobacteria bacterium]|nr:ADOP family duplicated permease [Gammaproteobacteria bacterium]
MTDLKSFGTALGIAGRELVRRPGISIAAWLALALGIALNTAMFSVVNGFLLRPLPVDDIDSVVRVREVARGSGAEQIFNMSPAAFAAWRESNTVFAGMAAATGQAVTLTDGDGAERLQAGVVTADFFDVLGIGSVIGRTFAAGEDLSGSNDVLLLSHELWQRRFDGQAGIVGRAIVVDGRPRTVVGVMPPGLHHPYEAEAWIPFAFDEVLRAPRGNFLYVPARLKPGVDIDNARRELDRLAATLHAERPELGNTNASRLVPLRDELLGTLRPVIFVLLAASLLVLGLAVLNVVNLLYARGVSEQHENAVRVALGARKADLFRRAFLRHTLLVIGAWLAGLALCNLTLEPLLGLSAAASIDEFDAAARLDMGTAAYGFVVALLVAVLLAFLEARGASGAAPANALGRSKDGGISVNLRARLAGLVVLQFALSFALAGSASLVAAGYERLVTGDRGYDPNDVTLFDLAFPEDGYPEIAPREALVSRLLERLRALPGISAAGAATVTPDYPGSWGGGFVVPGYEPPDPPGYELTNHRLASPGYLDTLGIPLLAGRDFDGRNTARDASAVIVSREFAEAYWGGIQEALGRTLSRVTGERRLELQIIGVAGDVSEAEQSQDWTETRTWYLPLSMGTDYDASAITIAVRGGHAQLPAAVRSLVQELDPDLAPFALMSMSDRLAETYSRERFSRFLFALFAVTACVIAVTGLYSALNFVTLLRRREFGLRVALGASPRTVAAGVLRGSLLTGGLGLIAGLPLLALLLVLLDSYFYGVSFGETSAVLWPAALLWAAAAVAASLPALRAARVEPAVALRDE